MRVNIESSTLSAIRELIRDMACDINMLLDNWYGECDSERTDEERRMAVEKMWIDKFDEIVRKGG